MQENWDVENQSMLSNSNHSQNRTKQKFKSCTRLKRIEKLLKIKYPCFQEILNWYRIQIDELDLDRFRIYPSISIFTIINFIFEVINHFILLIYTSIYKDLPVIFYILEHILIISCYMLITYGSSANLQKTKTVALVNIGFYIVSWIFYIIVVILGYLVSWFIFPKTYNWIPENDWIFVCKTLLMILIASLGLIGLAILLGLSWICFKFFRRSIQSHMDLYRQLDYIEDLDYYGFASFFGRYPPLNYDLTNLCYLYYGKEKPLSFAGEKRFTAQDIQTHQITCNNMCNCCAD